MATVAEKIKIGENHKIEGNEAFKCGEFKKALGSYHNAILYLKGLDNSKFDSMRAGSAGEPSMNGETSAHIANLLTSTHSNMAACYLKMNQPEKALKTCNSILAIDPKHAKGTFRKAQAYKATNDLDRAEKFFKAAVLLTPNDPAIRKELQDVRDLQKSLEMKSLTELSQNLKM